MKNDSVRILRDSAHEFEDFLISHLDDFLGGSIVVVQRPGVSNAKLLMPLVRLILNKNSTVVLPLSQPERALSGSAFSHSTILPGISWDQSLTSRHIYEFHDSHNQDTAAEMMLQFRYRFLSENLRETPVVFLIDTLQKWTLSFESEVRHLLHESPLINIGVWLHCPLYLIPTDLIPTIGSVLIISPTKGEIEILQNHMTAKELPQEDLSNGMLFIKRDSYEFRKMSRISVIL